MPRPETLDWSNFNELFGSDDIDGLQRRYLQAIDQKIEGMPHRFGHRKDDYETTAGIVAMSDWDERRKFIECADGARRCDIWNLCPYCAYLRKDALVEGISTTFSGHSWSWLTISFDDLVWHDSDLVILEQEVWDRWDDCLAVIKGFKRLKYFSGALARLEVEISFLPLQYRPHMHCLLMDADEAKMNRGVERLKTEGFNLDVEHDISGEHFRNTLYYMRKPFPLARAYRRAKRRLPDRRDHSVLNEEVTPALTSLRGLHYNTHSVRRYGSLRHRS